MTTPGMAGKSSSAGRRDRLSSSEGPGDFGTCPPWITGTQKTSAEILTMGRDDTTLGQDQVAPELRLAQDAAADELLGRGSLAVGVARGRRPSAARRRGGRPGQQLERAAAPARLTTALLPGLSRRRVRQDLPSAAPPDRPGRRC